MHPRRVELAAHLQAQPRGRDHHRRDDEQRDRCSPEANSAARRALLADIGVEGGSLAKMPGLIREARDMQGIRETASRKGGESKPAAAPATPTTGEPRPERTPRKKE